MQKFEGAIINRLSFTVSVLFSISAKMCEGTNAPPVPTALLSWQAHDSLECVAKTVDHFCNVFFHFQKFDYKAFFLAKGRRKGEWGRILGYEGYDGVFFCSKFFLHT